MSYNGSGTFQINTLGQPVVAGTVISSTAFNALTADLATGLSTAITKDGQTTTTARIPFAAGINSSSATDSTSSSTGSIITSGGVGIAKALNVGSATDSSSISTGSIVTAGGVGVAKNLYVGVNANIAGTLDVTGAVTVTNPVINNIKMGYTTTATAAGTTTLTAASNHQQFFTGTLAQTIVLPVTSTLALGMSYSIENNSTGTLTVQSSGLNTISTIPAGVTVLYTCILITGTTAASWDYDHIGFAAITGTGSAVLATSPTITTPTISQLTSAAATALTLQSAGTTAVTVDTSQNVGIGTASPTAKLHVFGATENQIRITDDAAYYYAIGRSSTQGFLTFYGSQAAATGYIFTGAAGERMRIGSSGNTVIGATAALNGALLTVQNSAGSGIATGYGTTSGQWRRMYVETTNNNLYFYNGNNEGYLTAAGAWTNASDARLKNSIVDIKHGLSAVMNTQPRSYKMNDLEGDYIGFVAQELQTVIPEVVSGNPERQLGVDYGSLVAVAFKAIQEQQALIQSLTTRITALEAL
jgi:hypothetical protein